MIQTKQHNRDIYLQDRVYGNARQRRNNERCARLLLACLTTFGVFALIPIPSQAGTLAIPGRSKPNPAYVGALLVCGHYHKPDGSLTLCGEDAVQSLRDHPNVCGQVGQQGCLWWYTPEEKQAILNNLNLNP